MSRVAKQPIQIPTGVEVNISGQTVAAKGPLGAAEMEVHNIVEIASNDGILSCSPKSADKKSNAMAGTMRALMHNLVTGVSKGFEKKLILKGIGYRAQAKGSVLNLTLGFSHPVNFAVPDGITVETPSQTEIVVKGVNKQVVGQVAANIRAYRPPEPYKGKGVRYIDEQVVMKDAKKK
ncbi:MAG: 50S ribosomal protein L6 [Gammaproteobacteria bacterium]|nr:50S ribosomal protein L6 [Gammaproteobacteria bacterium]